MKITNLNNIKPKQLIVFDLDGTLAPTKAAMDKEMSKLIEQLLKAKKVAVVGGGKYQLFQEQFLNELKVPKALLKNLFLFPTTATSFYTHQNGWKKVYALELSKPEKKKILEAFKRVFKEIGYKHPKKTYGKIIEDRGTQITFSAIGQDVVEMLGRKKGVALKEKWKKENTPLKLKIARLLAKYLPGLEVHSAGFTSIDITKKGIDKAYGLWQIQKYYAVVKTGVDYVPVLGPQQTKKVISAVLAQK